MIYIEIYFLLLFQGIYLDFFLKKQLKYDKVLFKINFLFFSCFSGLRYRLGFDTIHYFGNYNNSYTIMDIFDKNTWYYEIGFEFLMRLFKLLNFNYLFFQLFISLTINYFIFKLLKTSKYKYISIFIYYNLSYVYLNMEIIRQSFAFGLVLFGLNYLYNKNWKSYVYTVLFASLFHTSSVVYLILIIFVKLKINKKNLIKLSVLLLVFILIDNNLILSLFKNIIPYKYIFYLKSSLRNPSFLEILKYSIRFLTIPLFLLLLKNNNDEKLKNTKGLMINKIILLGIIIEYLSLKIEMLFRYKVFFDLFYIFILIYIVDFSITKYKFNKIAVLLLLLSYLNIVGMQRNIFDKLAIDGKPTNFYKYQLYYPYETLISKEKNSDREKIYQLYYKWRLKKI